jgi:hypothetical protein
LHSVTDKSIIRLTSLRFFYVAIAVFLPGFREYAGVAEDYIMKTKTILLLGVVLALMPLAIAKGKGKPAGEELSASCISTPNPGSPDGDIDTCSITGMNLVPGKAYQLEVVNNCSANKVFRHYVADAGGMITDDNIVPPEAHVGGCETTNWGFYLFTESKNGSQLKLVAYALALDED